MMGRLLSGRNFGAAGAAQVTIMAVGPFGRFDPRRCEVTVNHTEITCVTAPGVGKLDWTVEVGASNFAADGCCSWLLVLLLPWTLSACPFLVPVRSLYTILTCPLHQAVWLSVDFGYSP